MPHRLRYAAILFLLALLGLHCTKSTEPPPNILLVTLDTVRADHLGSYGYSMARTPHLDDLATQGVRFTQAISVAPVTLPAHASLLTGLYPRNHGVRNNGSFSLAPEQQSIAEELLAKGYDTAAVTAAFVLDSKFGLDQGFRSYDDDLGQGDKQKMFMFRELRAEQVVDKALTQLKTLREPFFLWVHLFDAHADYAPPPPYDMLFMDAPYDGEIAYVDTQLGRLFDGLQRTGKEARTVKIVTADHGESLGEHGEQTHGIFIYRATTHVPLLVAGPGVKGGHVASQLVSQVDLAPTLRELAGLPPQKSDGHSMLPLLKGQEQAIHANGVFLESMNPRLHFGWHEIRALDTGVQKFISTLKPEFYDLANDPRERDNRFGNNTFEYSKLQKRLNDFVGDDDASNLTLKDIDAESRAMLEALGYVTTSHHARGHQQLPDAKDAIHRWADLQHCQAKMRAERFEAARVCLQKLIQADPANITARFSLVSAFRKLGDLEAAEATAREALELDPNNLKALENLAWVLKDGGKMADAMQILQHATETHPQDPEPWSLLGDLQDHQQRYQEAMQSYAQALRRDERFMRAYTGIANALHKEGESERALAYLEKAVGIDKTDATAWYNMGVVLDHLQRTQQAEKAYRKALEIEPDQPMAFNNLGSLLSRAGRQQEAIAVFQAALKTKPDHVESLYNLGTLSLEDDTQQSITLLRRALELQPNLVPARQNLALAFAKLGRLNEARAQWTWLLNHLPEKMPALVAVAKFEAQFGSKDKARGLLRQAVKLDATAARERIARDPELAKIKL